MAPKRPQVVIMLLGPTGAGKTTFASVASGRRDLKIGHGLDSCTQDPQAIDFILGEHKVVLIDTPGFDDSIRSDLEILEGIGKWLAKEGFTSSRPVDGLVLLHPITHRNTSGMEKRRTQLLEKIMGKDAYKRIVVATTMWGGFVYEGDVDEAIVSRLRQGGVWGNLEKGGAAIVKHDNTSESAIRIVQSIIEKCRGSEIVETQLQKELATNRGRFGDTSLGRALREQLEAEIEEISSQIIKHRSLR